MQDKTYGWTVEMQLKVLKQNMSYVEIPVIKNRIEYLKCLEPLKVCNGWNKNNRLDLNIPSNKTMLQVSYIILFIYALSILLIFLWSSTV
jgi:hypothetical protein